MLDRERPLFFLRPATLAGAAGVSFALLAGVPALAATCLFAGGFAFAVCWIGALAPVLLGVVAVWGGVYMLNMPRELGKWKINEQDAKGLGCVSIVLGVVALFSVCWIWQPLTHAATVALNTCSRAGASLLTEVFFPFQLTSWSPVVFAVALLASGVAWLSLLVLRREHRLNYALFKIAYACPACHRRAVPHVRCPRCGDVLAGLGPSVYGLLSAKCGCGQVLPTTDFGGRRKLAKVCANPDCCHELKDPDLGRYGEYYLAVVGPVSAGKSTWLAASLSELEQEYAPQNRLRVMFGDPADEQRFRAWVDRLRRGEPVEKTPAPPPLALTLSAGGVEGQYSRMYLYDAPGGYFAEEVLLARLPYLRFADGLVFVFDPFLAENVPRDPATADAQDVVSRLVNHLEAALGTRAGRKFPLAAAVVVTKTDVLNSPADLDAGDPPEKVRQFLAGRGLANVLALLESRFHRVGYFAASAAGPPRGAVTPLVWLARQVRALGVRPTVAGAAWNGLRTTFGALRGQERPAGVAAPPAPAGGLRDLGRAALDAFRGRAGWRGGAVAWLLAYGVIALAVCGVWYANRRGAWSAEYVNRGKEWSQKGDEWRAVADYTRAIRLAPDNAVAYYNRGSVWYRLKDDDRALADLNRAIELRPQYAEAYNNRGLVWYRQNLMDRAIADYTAAVQHNPQLGLAYDNRGAAWNAKGDFDRAVADHTAALQMAPTNAAAFYNRGVALLNQQRYRQALDDFYQAVFLKPDLVPAWGNLAWIRASCPDPACRNARSAVDAATRWCELTAWKNAPALDHLAAGYAESKDFGAAVEWQRKAVAASPEADANLKAYRDRLQSYVTKRDRQR
jgi:tetratricopeptide (TPR) repeat protein